MHSIIAVLDVLDSEPDQQSQSNWKAVGMRPAIVWLKRARYHLESLKSEALAANDAVDYFAAGQSINLLDVLADVLERSEQCARRNKREQERARRQELAKNRKLVARLLEIDPTTKFDVDVAA